ncbi:MAG: hypothetical protein OXF79_23720 [Chloroflexi bacterium]|nr:hypothetical protein [Chloroflexota bacterium]
MAVASRPPERASKRRWKAYVDDRLESEDQAAAIELQAPAEIGVL